MKINKLVKIKLEGLGTAPGESGILTKTAKFAHDGFFKPVSTTKRLVDKLKDKLRKI